MDPDAALKRLLRLDPETSAIAEAVQNLDAWLTNGGWLPAKWRRRPVFIAVFRYTDGGRTEETVHTSKAAAEKKICQYLYEERMRLRDWSASAQRRFMLALMRHKWADALQLWRENTTAETRWAGFVISETVIEGEDDIRFQPRADALRPRPGE